MSVIKITKNDFQSVVLDSGKPVLVDFWASWCGPCKRLAPIIDEFAEDHPEFKIGKVNIDDESELTRQFHIRSVPTLIVFKGGDEVGRVSGVVSEEEMLELLQA